MDHRSDPEPFQLDVLRPRVSGSSGLGESDGAGVILHDRDGFGRRVVTGVRFEREFPVCRDGEVSWRVMKIADEKSSEVGELSRAQAEAVELGLHAGEGLDFHLARAP